MHQPFKLHPIVEAIRKAYPYTKRQPVAPYRWRERFKHMAYNLAYRLGVRK